MPSHACCAASVHVLRRFAQEEEVLVKDKNVRVEMDGRTAAYVRKLLPRAAAKYWMQRYSLFSR